MADPSRTRIVLVTGLRREHTGAVATRYLRAAPGTVAVHHDLREVAKGVVRRRVRSLNPDNTVADATTVLELAHGCVSCTLREDLLPLLRTLSATPGVRRVVLHLDPMVEPEPVCWALHHVLVGDRTVTDAADIEAVVAVIDERTWLTDATGELALADLDLGVPEEDDRTLAQVAVAQVEFADAVVIAEDAPDPWAAARLAAVLDRLTPDAPRTRLRVCNPARLVDSVPSGARRGELSDAHGPLLRGQPPLDPDCGVTVTVFRDPKPFHPARLHEAIDTLLEGVVRARGRVWVASQPDVALWLESAGGGLRVGHAGTWLAAADDSAWDRVDPSRRTKAALDWHPRFGDRVQEIVVIAHEAAPDDIVDALTAALLTDEELRAEPDWPRYPDPFGEWHADPCQETTDLEPPMIRKETP